MEQRNFMLDKNDLIEDTSKKENCTKIMFNKDCFLFKPFRSFPKKHFYSSKQKFLMQIDSIRMFNYDTFSVVPSLTNDNQYNALFHSGTNVIKLFHP
jgi:hypothetical protein